MKKKTTKRVERMRIEGKLGNAANKLYQFSHQKVAPPNTKVSLKWR